MNVVDDKPFRAVRILVRAARAAIHIPEHACGQAEELLSPPTVDVN